MRRQRRARRNRLSRDPPRRPCGGGGGGEAGRFHGGAHHDPAVRGEDADRQLFRLVRAARRFPAHARAVHGRQAQARRADHAALLHQRGPPGLPGHGGGAQRAGRDRLLEMTQRILVVDDQRTNAEMLAGLLRNLGYQVDTALDGAAALEKMQAAAPDLVVSDIMMPRMDGFELCRRIRAAPSTSLLPVILVTSADPQTERVKGIEAGADDFITKPVNWAEMFARVKSLLRTKGMQDEIRSWNAQLEERVRSQVQQLEQLSRLKQFFSRQVAEAIIAGGEDLLKPHRREITAVFLDLRGFTAFTDRADPEEVLDLLRAYHVTMGRTVDQFEGTLEHFAGDGMMIFFNDPFPVEAAGERAVRMAIASHEAFRPIAEAWEKLGHHVGLGIGIAQ